MTSRSALQQSLYQLLVPHLPAFRPEVHRALATLAVGFAFAATIHLPRLAAEAGPLAGCSTRLPSRTQRLVRLLRNARITRQRCWDPLLRLRLARHAPASPHLVLDFSHLPRHHVLVVVALVIGPRALPLTWSVQSGDHPWDQRLAELLPGLLDPIAHAMPPARDGSARVVTLLADAGLASPALIRACQTRGWHWVVRLPATPRSPLLVRTTAGGEERLARWRPDPTAPRPARPRTRHVRAELFKTHGWVAGWVTVHDDAAYEDVWLLFGDRPTGAKAMRAYRHRMAIETLFGEWKRRGWDLTLTRVTQAARLERLLIGLALAQWWLTKLGQRVVRAGERGWYERRDRRTWSLVQLGRRWLERREQDRRSFGGWRW